MKFVNGLVVNEANVLHLLAHLWCYSRMAVRYGTVRRYSTVRLNFCQEVRYAGTVRFFCNGTGTLRWYGTPFV